MGTVHPEAVAEKVHLRRPWTIKFPLISHITPFCRQRTVSFSSRVYFHRPSSLASTPQRCQMHCEALSLRFKRSRPLLHSNPFTPFIPFLSTIYEPRSPCHPPHPFPRLQRVFKSLLWLAPANLQHLFTNPGLKASAMQVSASVVCGHVVVGQGGGGWGGLVESLNC